MSDYYTIEEVQADFSTLDDEQELDFHVVIEDHDAQLSNVVGVRWDDNKRQYILIMGDKVESSSQS